MARLEDRNHKPALQSHLRDSLGAGQDAVGAVRGQRHSFDPAPELLLAGEECNKGRTHGTGHAKGFRRGGRVCLKGSLVAATQWGGGSEGKRPAWRAAAAAPGGSVP